MGDITVREAINSDIDWINSKYEEVGFPISRFYNEYILIAEVESKKAGLGRLVNIDSNNIELGGIYVFPSFRGVGVANKLVCSLCDKNPYKARTIWCLPFENLYGFYASFGFQKGELTNAPPEIVEKYNWCNNHEGFAQNVLLLVKYRSFY